MVADGVLVLRRVAEEQQEQAAAVIAKSILADSMRGISVAVSEYGEVEAGRDGAAVVVNGADGVD